MSAQVESRPVEVMTQNLKEHDGRLYNDVQDDYALPADQEEIDRLNSQHRALTMLYDSLIPEPIKASLVEQTNPRILDVGCGTGIWSIEVAEEIPTASVIGVDLVSIHPKSYPSNVLFQKLDILESFPEGWEGSFDLVHARYLIAGIRDFSLLLSRLTKLLKPNGHLIIMEPQALWNTVNDDIHKTCPSTAQISKIVYDAMLKLGIDPIPGKRVSEHLKANVQYDQVETITKDLPLSPWSSDPRMKEIGQAHLPVTLTLPGAFRRLTLSSGLIDEEAYDKLVRGSQEEVRKAEGQLIFPVWLIWARKK
ncbi:uncharacterized protein I303_106883 [Kwoniella dejecticola CBS 10117]|uniref:Methyltransferase domain-containing protein n=1 Tax=Kwoniella dejecticola CBS 10117 TaxID=1296121 RepID=A0A1A5ZTE8_9TREE|nr:uncharacterized protein I303_08478 [Kwoniella dejecticola CBS 10117]OBR81096.1 hypothetical protein I303_08478 [Kwoniella dejecticola CBS 10117]